MIVEFRVGSNGNGTVYYGVSYAKLLELKKKYEKAGWKLLDFGEIRGIRIIEIN